MDIFHYRNDLWYLPGPTGDGFVYRFEGLRERMRIFISGPYTNPDPVTNTRNAILAGNEVAKLGHIPFIPHLNIQWHMVCPHDPDFWYEYDLKWLNICDAILRLPGESWGADKEVEYALSKDKKVFYGIDGLRSIS